MEPHQSWISGETNQAVVSGPPFESFALSFYIVLFKSLLITREPLLISSEANYMFDKIKQKLCPK